MTQSFRSHRRGLGMVFLFCSAFSLQAQQVQKPANSQQPIKGHGLYKQSKIYDAKTGRAKETKPKAVGDRAQDRIEYEFERLKDPNTNKIPLHIKELEAKFSSKIATSNDLKKSLTSRTAKSGGFSYWKNRGPFNVGGRTRALAIDANNESVILAGGVSGGLWRSTNAGASWKKITSRKQSPSITCIVQDTTSFGKRTWYYGSGERLGNSAGAGGAFFQGSGIYKSTNGGLTWRLLEATKNDSLTRFTSFNLINSLAINPTNGDLYVATFDGIFRSKNGGNSFEPVFETDFDDRGEVVISSSGKIYVTISSNGDINKGFFTSTDGDTWTDITPDILPESYGRTVVGIDPSNENNIYFFTQNTTPGGIPALLNRYDATKTGAEAWTDVSANLPLTISGPAGNINLQGGYNMVVKVHPADSNIVFVGGTNLYRSKDAFATPLERKDWIAGYSPLSSGFGQYANQHPDQHELLFYPSNPNKAISGNDGGVYITEDITAENEGEAVTWIDINNGYLTTQPYGVSFDPEANSDDLVSGFQDNGTWYTNSTDGTTAWTEDFGGDGAINAIADGGRTRYVSSQRGNIYRLNFDENGQQVSFARVNPAGASNFGFIAPFILDANNDNIMYLPEGNIIWRNNNLDELPIFTNATPSKNWVKLENTAARGNIVSLDVSTYPVANRLYFGTSNGGIYKMDNANIDNQEVIDIATGKGLPETGFVNDINVDPSDSDRVIVTFSNYGIPSLFLTEDGGETWTNISGNLEENADGTGNGPSVRSTAFFGSSQGILGSRLQRVFAATSTGLYSAITLRGERTRWTKEPFIIGNAVADEVKTRKDGFVALSVHGNGLFSAKFPLIRSLPESELQVAYLLEDIKADENSEPTTISVADLFVHTGNDPIDIKITNSNPELVTAVYDGDTITLTYAPDSVGQASIGLVATSGVEQVSEGFTVFVSEPSIYEQTEDAIGNNPSQFFPDFGGLAQSADDFTVPEENTWKINRILALGSSQNSPALTNATIVIYKNNEGVPGEEVYNSGELTPISEPNDTNLNLLLPEEVTLTSGDYWISIYVNLPFNPNRTLWFWSTQENTVGAELLFQDNLNLYGTGATTWTPASIAFTQDPADAIFQLFGEVEDTTVTPETTTSINNDLMPLTELNAAFKALAWPNPSKGEFTFNLSVLGLKKAVNLKVFDISGKLVYNQENLDATSSHTWDASQMKAGFYFVKLNDINIKVIKQ